MEKDLATKIVEFARLFLFVREVPQNKGLRVEAIQHWCGGKAGDSWCCFFVTMVLDIIYQGKAPIPRLGAVESVYSLAVNNNWLTEDPVPGDLFMYIDDNDHAHHIGIFTGDGNGIAGNTSEDGTSPNGDRVAEHKLITNPKHIKYIHYLKSE